jgi:hypothetical protein
MDLDRYIAARILQADLIAVDAHFSEVGISDMKGIICLKNAFIALANLVDFELTVRTIYAEHRELSRGFMANQKQFEFAKYLRNKYVGHIHPDLIKKAIEWKPELVYMAAHMGDNQTMLMANIFLLETAINTYVDENGKHKVFDSETDLMYPPDWQRFLRFLEDSARSAIAYLTDLCAVLNGKLNHPDPRNFDFGLSIKAGATKFSFLKK